MRTVAEIQLGVALIASCLLLLALDRDHRRGLKKSTPNAALSPLALRILADAVLLTPLLFLIPWKL